ncbi:MAG: type VII toxin-antitoxin system MntA family adenylyltransferase antitoxin [Thermoguttaceae bacterium]
MDSSKQQAIIDTVLRHYPDVQGVYLFGSYAAENQWPQSDVDIALLLPPEQAKQVADLCFSPCRLELENVLHKDVDLINARRVSTVFQKEIIVGGRLIYCSDQYAVDEFEMLGLSFYQKLNEERAEILAEGLRTGRFYNV